MGLSTNEQETIILLERNSDIATIYTSDSRMLPRLDKKKNYKRVKVDMSQDGKIIAATYEADRRLITLRSKRRKSNMTEEQKAKAAERLARIRAAK